MGDVEWRVTVRRPDGTRGPQVRDWLRLALDDRLMRAGDAPGTLQVDVPLGHRAAAELATPGAGLILETLPATGRVEWSGDVVSVKRAGWSTGTLSVIASDDNDVFVDDQAFPVASTDVAVGSSTLFGAAADVRTGPAETVWLALVAANIGPAAGVARRRYSWLSLPTSAGRGATVTSSARMVDLLTLAQQLLIPSGLACRAVHSDPAGIAVQVWAPTRPAAARYGRGQVRDLEWTTQAPTADEVLIGGAGDGASRLFTRVSSTPWGRRRRVRFIDSSQSGTASVAAADTAAQVAELGATESVRFRLVPSGGAAQYGVDLHVGDLAEVSLPGRSTPLVDVVRRVELSIDSPTSPPAVSVTVGWPDPEPEQVTVARVRSDVAALVRS